jgi:hypothetical protein
LHHTADERERATRDTRPLQRDAERARATLLLHRGWPKITPNKPMLHAFTTHKNNELQIADMSDRSNQQAFEQSKRDMARLQEFGKTMESKAISDGQRNKYTAKLKELRTFLHDFEKVEEDGGRGGAITYKKTRPFRKFVSEKAKYAFGIKGKSIAKKPEIVELFLMSLKPCKRGRRAENGQQQQESEEWVGKGVPMLKQYRAAISHMFSVQDVEPSTSYSNHMKKFFKGLGNDAAAKGKRRKAKESGKDSLPYPLYIDIMQKYGAVGKCMFVAFLGMTWNLICRGKQTANIYLSQLRVDNDAITVSYESTKTDSEGRTTTTLEPRHLYANPFNWKCCIFTWLGILFLTESNLHISNVEADEDCLLFPGRYVLSRNPKLLVSLRSPLSTKGQENARAQPKRHLCQRTKKRQGRKRVLAYCFSSTRLRSQGQRCSFCSQRCGHQRCVGIHCRAVHASNMQSVQLEHWNRA